MFIFNTYLTRMKKILRDNLCFGLEVFRDKPLCERNIVFIRNMINSCLDYDSEILS